MASNRDDPFEEDDLLLAPSREKPPSLAPVLSQLKGLRKDQLDHFTGLELLQRTLDEDLTPMLHRLEQRPVVDVEAITQRLDQTIDAVDRVMQRRIPRLVARRWWVVWLWLVTGIALGAVGCWWVTQTPQGQAILRRVWPQAVTQPVTVKGKR